MLDVKVREYTLNIDEVKMKIEMSVHTRQIFKVISSQLGTCIEPNFHVLFFRDCFRKCWEVVAPSRPHASSTVLHNRSKPSTTPRHPDEVRTIGKSFEKGVLKQREVQMKVKLIEFMMCVISVEGLICYFLSVISRIL